MKLKNILINILIIFILLNILSCGEDDIDMSDYPNYLTIAAWNVEDFKYSYIDFSIENFKFNNSDTIDYSNTAYIRTADFLKTNNIDVVCLQEMQPGNSLIEYYSDGSRSSPGDTVRFNKALSAVGYPMRYFGYNNDGRGRNDYVAYWSRYKISESTSIKPVTMIDPSTGNVYDGYRPILRFKLKFNSKVIWFYGMHLKSNAGGIVEYNMGLRRAQSFHLANYIMKNHDPENDLIVILGDMNTMPADYDGSGNSTIDYLCLRYDNPYNTANDFIPVNLKHLGAITNWSSPGTGGTTPGMTHPGTEWGYPDATFDHIILSPKLYNDHYVPGSIRIPVYYDENDGPADHCPVILKLTNL